MAPPNPLPQYVYKIIPAPPPSPIPDSFPLSELDKKDGFVHLSAAFQVCRGFSFFFSSTFFLLLFLTASVSGDSFNPTDPHHAGPLLQGQHRGLDPAAAPVSLSPEQGQVGRGGRNQRMPALLRQLWRQGCGIGAALRAERRPDVGAGRRGARRLARLSWVR